MQNTIKIERIAVLGAGVMGAQLAGLFANKGIRTSLFDISIYGKIARGYNANLVIVDGISCSN